MGKPHAHRWCAFSTPLLDSTAGECLAAPIVPRMLDGLGSLWTSSSFKRSYRKGRIAAEASSVLPGFSASTIFAPGSLRERLISMSGEALWGGLMRWTRVC
jgi:hypothetical protein